MPAVNFYLFIRMSNTFQMASGYGWMNEWMHKLDGLNGLRRCQWEWETAVKYKNILIDLN